MSLLINSAICTYGFIMFMFFMHFKYTMKLETNVEGTTNLVMWAISLIWIILVSIRLFKWAFRKLKL